MIGAPLNDHRCLGQINDEIASALELAEVRNVAVQFATMAEVAAWLRSLPQRNDDGDPGDGPRVPCDVSQRLRFAPADPNCVERSATYLAAGELIAPWRVRQLATIDTPLGRHTFPVEDGQPVNLDPRVGRNALAAGLDRIVPQDMGAWTPGETMGWIVALAREPAGVEAGGMARVRNAADSFEAVMCDDDELPRNGLADMAYTLGLAEQAGRLFGVRGMETVQLGRLAIEHLMNNRQRNLRIAGIKIPSVVERLGRVVGRVGEKVGGIMLRTKLMTMGIPPQLLDEFERELNREGLSLGRAARPLPMLGSWDALTDEALILRRIQQQVR